MNLYCHLLGLLYQLMMKWVWHDFLFLFVMRIIFLLILLFYLLMIYSLFLIFLSGNSVLFLDLQVLWILFLRKNIFRLILLILYCLCFHFVAFLVSLFALLILMIFWLIQIFLNLMNLFLFEVYYCFLLIKLYHLK